MVRPGNHADWVITNHPSPRDSDPMFEHVVVGVRAEEAGRDAIALAKVLKSAHAELTLLHVHVAVSKPAPDSVPAWETAERHSALERLAALAAECAPGAQVSWVESRSVRRGLHEFASHQQADLLVVGASHCDEVARDLIGEDTRAVLAGAPCVVAVAPVGYAARRVPLRKIGVGYDGSAESERALSLARELSEQSHAELAAFEAVTASHAGNPWDLAAEFAEPVRQARLRITALGGVEADAGFGDAVEELTRYSQSVDLLVVGSHSYRPIDRLLEMSTSQQLADRASSPLLVLSSPSR
jgi:nucleotide-binding universal stress UspA family protein